MRNPEAEDRAAAILLIHGIGEQQPYETLDAFVQGLARECKIAPGRLEHRLSMCGERVATSVRLHPPAPVGRLRAQAIDVYEFHWAGMVEGKIRLHQVLWWLIRVALTPLRLWSYQATLPSEAAQRDGGMRPVRFLLGELLRSAGLLLVAFVVVAPFVYAVLRWQIIVNAWRGLWGVLRSLHDPVAWALLATLFGIAAAISRGYFRLARWLRSASVTERAPLTKWKKSSAIAMVVLAACAVLLQQAYRLDVRAFLYGIWNVVRPPAVASVLVLGVLALFLSRVLVKYVGDIALYATADENASFFRTRAKILDGAAQVLKALCDNPAYEGVYVAGHSLGSVIGYDAINRLVRDARVVSHTASSGSGISRLRGLLTFGSPLDTVYYFFRTVVEPSQPIRAQVLSSLHAFRKQPSGRDYGPFQFARYELPRLNDFIWLNVFSPSDHVSRRLVFYQVDRQESRSYPIDPIGAHLAYWTDRGFYGVVAEWL